MTKYWERDLWWEARQKTAARWQGVQPLIKKALFTFKNISVPGLPTKERFFLSALAQRPDVVVMPDYNKYRRGKNLQEYVDAGVEAFLFRLGGPLQWVEGLWNYTLDPSWPEYFVQADKLGIVDQTIGYIVQNPFEDFRTKNAQDELIHTALIDEWTGGGYMPRAFMYDHEISKAWRNTGVPIYCVGPNLVDSLAENTLNTWQRFHRTVGVYTADWFIESNEKEHHYTWFTNINKPVSQGGEGTQRPTVMAWYYGLPDQSYSTVAQLLDLLHVPTPQQVAAYLWAGYDADAWQFTNRWKLNADAIGVDCTISLGSKKEFFYNFGLIQPGVEPPPPPPPPPDEDLKKLIERVDGLESQFLAHSHTVGPLSRPVWINEIEDPRPR